MKGTTLRLWVVFFLLCVIFYPMINKASSSEEEVLDAYLIAFPDVKNIGVIYSEAKHEETISKLEKIAGRKKLNVVKVKVPSLKELPGAFQELKGKVDTCWALDDPLFSTDEVWNYFILFTLRSRIKTVVFNENALMHGGLFYYTDSKEIMINRNILTTLGLQVSKKAEPVKYY